MKRRIFFVLPCLLLAGLINMDTVAQDARDRTEVSTDDPYLTDQAGGRHAWYVPVNSPNGYYHEPHDKTYLTFHGGGGDEDFIDPLVMSYDHATGAIDGPAKVGENPLAARMDYHGNPAIIVDDAGYIHVIYGGHARENQMKHAVSKRPGDISEWEHLENIATKTTYPCLVKLDDGRIFYFYRDGSHRADWAYVVSDDHGRTFGETRVLTRGAVVRDDGKYYDGEYWDSWYGTFRKGPDGAIHHITKYHTGAPDWGDAYHGERRTNLYYARYVPGNGWQNLEGRTFDLPLTLPVMDEHFMIFDSPIKKGAGMVFNTEVNDVTFDDQGRVYVGYRFGHGAFNYKWRITRLAILSPGAKREKTEPWNRLTTKIIPFGSDYETMGKWGWAMDVVEGKLTIFGDHIRVSKDRGDTWHDLGPMSPVGLEDPVRIENAHPDARLMAANPRPDAPYRERNVYLWGDGGFVTPDVELDWIVHSAFQKETRLTLIARNRTEEGQQGTVRLAVRSQTSGVNIVGDTSLSLAVEPGSTFRQAVVIEHPPQYERIYLRARPAKGPWTWADHTLMARPAEAVDPLLRVVDMNVGETREVTLQGGDTATVTLLRLQEERDSVIGMINKVRADVEVNGEAATLFLGNYNLPDTVGGVKIDFTAADVYMQDASQNSWGLREDARFRLWPEDTPAIRPGTFVYPVEQRWMASTTWYSNEPVGQVPSGKIYYHSGMDIGASEGEVDVFSATDGLVVTAAGDTLAEMPSSRPQMRHHYAGVWIRDARGWYHYYTHLSSVNVEAGQWVRAGQKIGAVGKESRSGGWSHLHYEIKSLQPSGEWGTQDSYAFLMQAYREQHDPELLAVARPHHLVYTDEPLTLDATRSWSKHGVQRYVWMLSDGSSLSGAVLERTYSEPGTYSEVLEISDAEGNVAYDVATVRVVDKSTGKRAPSPHATYFPTTGITPGDEVIFKVRTRGDTSGFEVWDFGDGSPTARTYSNRDPEQHAPDGYATTTHRFANPGTYVVTVQRYNDVGTGTHRLIVHVGQAPRTRSRSDDGSDFLPRIDGH